MLERLYRRTVAPDQVTTPELTSFLCECSAAVRRQVGVLLDRRGHVLTVVVGDAHGLVLPRVDHLRRAGPGRLRGVRLLHTHLAEQGLDQDDLTDLTLLALDLVAAVTLDDAGRPSRIHVAHLVPHDPHGGEDAPIWMLLDPAPWHALSLDFGDFVRALEEEFRRKRPARRADDGQDRAILVHVDDGPAGEAEASLEEMRELARTAGVRIVDEVAQRRRLPDPRYVMGRGKLQQLNLRAMHREVELVIFDRDLTPGQARAIADLSELRVIDRTQLILDIFAQRATTRAGKRRVELAQLKYTLPRLVRKNTAMSRLTGGIGGRGPGETKLEMERRRAQERIRQLEQEIAQLALDRQKRRRRRERRAVPSVGIVGYTNAGKSTLLNALTASEVNAEDKLFATLDPTSRRLRFPSEREVILTDTVGFIRDLPADLVSAFLATLEELQSADLLIHVVDASSTHVDQHIGSVNAILDELSLGRIPRLVAFNKTDRLADWEHLDGLCRAHDGLAICALRRDTLRPLLSRVARLLWPDEAAPFRDPNGTNGSPSPERPGRDGVRTERIET